jgi:acetyl esterase/lipase
MDPQTYTYKTVGECAIQADVYTPDDLRSRPVLVWIHGGALIGGSRDAPAGQLDRCLDAGYAFVSIDYRLAPETKLPAIIDDLRDAFRWVREMGADPRRVAVSGGSAGGYLTLMTGFCLDYRPRALVPFYGYCDLLAPWLTQPSPHYVQQPLVPREEALASVGQRMISGAPGPNERGRFYLYCRQQALWPKEVGGFDPQTQPEAFYPFCPHRNVTADYPPTLLLHGDADTDVPYEQSVQMAAALARAGVEHELITIAGGGHGFDYQPGPATDNAFARVMAFLKRHLEA